MKRKTIIAIMTIFSLFFLTGCDQFIITMPTTTTTQEEITTDLTTVDSSTTVSSDEITTEQGNLTQKLMFIYDLAVDSGEFDGTYEEWLESVRGPQGEPGVDGRDIAIQVSDGFIQWKYVDEETWNDLIELSALVGPAGEDGKEVLFQVADGYIQWQYSGETTWTNLIDLATLTGANGEDGTNGVDGREVLLQVADGYIQWQYSGETTWTNLIDLATLTGTNGEDGTNGVDGREVLFQVAGGYIQWQYSGDTTWTNLIDLATLTGADGEDGTNGVDGREVLFQVAGGYIQWQYSGETTWTNLIDLATLTGADGEDGTNGVDGREVLFQVADGYIQWQYSGDTTWTDLLEISTLTGNNGISITETSFNETGELIITYSDGSEYNLGVPIVLYTVNFFDYNGYLLDSKRVSYGSEVLAPENPSRTGYTFTGWTETTANVINDIDVYAQYEINKFSVEFDTNTTETLLNITEVPYGSKITLPNLEMQGYRFLGWYLGETANSQQFFNESLVYGDLILHAKWEKIEYKVNYLGFNNELLGSYIFTIDDEIIYPEVPVIDGYQFKGWDKEIDYSSEIFNLKAIYEELYSVNFYTDGGTEVASMEDLLAGEDLELPTPEKMHYVFVGWYIDSGLTIEFDGIMTAYDLTLYAKYTKAAVIIGAKDQIIATGSSLDLSQGISAFDDEDGFIYDIEYVTNLDSNVPGEYTVTYIVEDSDGAVVSKDITVTVSEATSIVYPTGIYNFQYASAEIRNTFMAAAERYLMDSLYGGIPLYQSPSYQIFSDRTDLLDGAPTFTVGYLFTRGSLLSDDSDVEFRPGIYGNAGEYTFRMALNDSYLPNTWNHLANNNVPYNYANYDQLYNLINENLYRYNYDFENETEVIEPALAASEPVAIDGITYESNISVSDVWQITLKQGLEWGYHPNFDTSYLPEGHQIIDAYDFYDTYIYALENNWYNVANENALMNLVSGIAIKNAAEFVNGEADVTEVGIRVIDDLTIEFEFTEEVSSFFVMDLFSDYHLAPANNEILEEYKYNYTYDYNRISASGPYMPNYLYEDEFEDNPPAVNLIKNDMYHDSELYNYTNYYINFTTDDFYLYQQGLLDRLMLTYTEAEEYIDDPNLVIVDGTTIWKININSFGTLEEQQSVFPESDYGPEPILANANFKKAMFHAIDRSALAETLPGSIPQINFYTEQYYVNILDGIPYRDTEAGLSVGKDFLPETFGYNETLARAYFEMALDEMISSGLYQEGTESVPNEIVLYLYGMSGSAVDHVYEMIKADFERIFVSEEHNINVKVVVEIKSFPGIYYDYLMTGEFDLGLGAVSGSYYEAVKYMDIFADDNRGGFTLNWGIDTSTANIPIEYTDGNGVKHLQMWSYNAIQAVLNGEVYINSGQEDILNTASERLEIPKTDVEGFETMELPVFGYLYTPITWSVVSGNATINNNMVISFGNEATDYSVVLQAEISNGNDTIIKTFNINVNCIPIVEDFLNFTNMTDGVYDIADGYKVAISGIVTLVDEDLVLLTDNNGNSIYVVFLDADEFMLGTTMDFVGVVVTYDEYIENSFRYIDADDYYYNITGYNGVPEPTVLTASELVNLDFTEYYKKYSFTGFEVTAINEYGEVYLQATDGTSTEIYVVWLNDDDRSWFESSFPVGSILPETVFGIIYDMVIETEVYHYILGFDIPEAESYIIDYLNVFYGAASELEINSQYLDDIYWNAFDISVHYMQSYLQSINATDPFSLIVEDLDNFLLGLKDIENNHGYNTSITTITYDGIDYEWVDDPLATTSLWTEVNGTELLRNRIMENLISGQDEFIITINDGSVYKQDILLEVNIYKDYLYDFENLLIDSIYQTDNNVYFGYYVDYVALDVELMLYGDVADESFESISDFFDEFTIRIFENQNMLNTDISHITYEGVEYHYDTNYWSWTDASGNYLEMVISDMLHDSWIINQEPIYSFTITIVDVNGVSTDLTLTFVFE